MHEWLVQIGQVGADCARKGFSENMPVKMLSYFVTSNKFLNKDNLSWVFQ